MEFQEVEKLVNSSVEGIEYSVNNISKIITVPITIVLLYLSLNSALMFSIIMGLFATEIITYYIFKDKALSTTEILTMISSKFSVDIPLDIVVEESRYSMESSMVLGKTPDGNDRALIYINDLEHSYKLRILSNVKIVYHMYVYMSIISLATSDKFGYEDASESITISKLHALIRTILFVPKLYSQLV